MNDRTNQLIQAYDSQGEQIGLFRITGNNCPLDHLQIVLKEYFEEIEEDANNADLNLFRWGIERVYIDHEINI